VAAIIGGSIAFELSRRNLRVAVLDRQEMMHEASWRRRHAFAGARQSRRDSPGAAWTSQSRSLSKFHRCRRGSFDIRTDYLPAVRSRSFATAMQSARSARWSRSIMDLASPASPSL